MAEHVVPTDHAVAEHEHDPGGHHSPEQIKREMRVYLYVLGALGVLTAATVSARFHLHLPTGQAIALALAIATVKGFLVAGFFMHLLSERKLIYAILILTVVFFGILLWLPVHDVIDKF